MDTEQDQLHSLGFFAIWRKCAKIIAKERNIFVQIVLTLILPLVFFFLAHSEASSLLLRNISYLEYTLENDVFAPYEETSMALSRAWGIFFMFQGACIVSLFAFSILSSSAIFYTVACIFSGKRVSFKEVIRVVPKLWKKTMVTSLYVIVIAIGYRLVFCFVAITYLIPLPLNNFAKYIFLGAPFLVLYMYGLHYIVPFCQLGAVVSVLEGSCGLQALRRSKVLAKGKMGIPRGVNLVVPLGLIGTGYLYLGCVVFTDQSKVGVLKRVGFGIVCLFLLSIFMLFGLVLQPVIYFVCKSCLREQIEKSALGGYVLVDSKGIKLKEQR